MAYHGLSRKMTKSPPTRTSTDEQEVAATTTEATNETLYAAHLRGNGNALRILMERYGNPLILYINGYIHDIHEAEDLMIEAFSRMLDAKPRLIENGFKAYVYKIARNLALRHADSRRRHSCFSLEALEDEPESGLLVEAIVQTEEQNRILLRCMEQINPDYCEALYLLCFENMSYAQAAQVMGKTTKQIDHLLERGKKALSVIDNAIQLAVTTGCGIYAAVLFLRRKDQAWFLLTCFYGAFVLGLIYWFLFLLFRSGVPQISPVSDLSWLASVLFLLVQQTTIRLPGEGTYWPLWAWTAPVFCAVLCLYFFRWGDYFLNTLWAVLMGRAGTVPCGGCCSPAVKAVRRGAANISI